MLKKKTSELNLSIPEVDDTALLNDRPVPAAAGAAAVAALVRDDTNDSTDAGDGKFFSDNVRILSPTRMVLKRFFRSKLSIIGLVTLLFLFVFSFLMPLFNFLPFIWGQEEIDRTPAPPRITQELIEYEVNGVKYEAYNVMIDEFSINMEAKPSKTHWLGTDANAYDVFSRLMYGGRVSLTIGLVVVILQTLLGVLFGGLAGYFGKWVDQIIMRIVDIFNCVPTLPLMLIISTALDALKIEDITKLYVMMALLTLLGWVGTARLVRGQILSLREQEFMIAAEATGLSVPRKIFRHLIPNVMPQLIVTMTLGLGSVILTEATLGFLGLGLPSNYATWGNMINAAAKMDYLTNFVNLWIPPGVCIVLAVLAFNFIGDGLRDAFDPKGKR